MKELRKLSYRGAAFLAAIVIMSAGVSGFAQKVSNDKVIAYYFHGAFRCPTCTMMESYSKEAIETNFKDALASGTLEFKAVNVEDRGNEHFVSEYELYTKSLILSYVQEGREIRSKNLDKIWEYAGNKQKFISYVTEEIGTFLGEAQ
ncbi:MAG: hypothetical protein KKC84_04265 [Candidatus Omnitrophica bacterium]|nr:hypothetical protein [Candidatus Omnitrophota bacterium]